MKRITVLFLLLLFSISSCQNESPSIYESVKQLNELELLEFELSKTVQLKDYQSKIMDIIVDFVPHGERNAVIEISKMYEMYIDLSQLRESDIIKDTNMNIISINLPPVKDNYKGIEKIYYPYEESTVFQISEDERGRAEDDCSKQLDDYYREFKTTAEFFELKKQAENKARIWIESILVDIGYDQVNIDFMKDDIENY